MQQIEDDVEVRVIIADDCSTDRTLDIIKSYESKSTFQFVYLDSSKNLGIAQNYRRAYKSTVADYVAILEGDDYWNDKYRIQKHIDYLSTHTECVMTKNNYLVYSNKHNEWSSEIAKNNIITLRKALIEYELVNMSCCVFRGDLLRNMDERVYDYGHKQMKEATDWYTHLYLLQFGYGYVFEDIMSVYRIDTGANVSRTIRSYDQIINKGYLCYQLSLDLVGENYKNECYNRYLEAVEICRNDKRNLLYQKYSDYIPPILASFIFYKIPVIWWNIKHTLRNFIPNKLYKIKKKM